MDLRYAPAALIGLSVTCLFLAFFTLQYRVATLSIELRECRAASASLAKGGE